MRQLLFSAISMFIWAVAPVQAEDRPVLVELYTSQGCSSCPPADAYLHKLAARDDVIALALHVDYWDYIGWKDSFATPQYTQRQRQYAQAAGRSMVYTPQMIIDGAEHVVGNRPKDVEMLIEARHARPEQVEMQVSAGGGKVQVSAQPQGMGKGDYRLYLAHYSPKQSVEITRGENAGKTLSYAHVVRSLSEIGQWDGQGALELTAPLKGDQPAVVILQRAGPREVIAARYVE